MLNASQEQNKQGELAARSGLLLPWLQHMATAAQLDLRALLQSLIDTTYGTQDALAKAIGISPSRISRVLKNPDSLAVANCLRLAKVTGLSPDEIFRAAGKTEIAELIHELYGPAATPSGRERVLAEMSEETLQTFRNLMDQMAKDSKRKRGRR